MFTNTMPFNQDFSNSGGARLPISCQFLTVSVNSYVELKKVKRNMTMQNQRIPTGINTDKRKKQYHALFIAKRKGARGNRSPQSLPKMF
jgi:hypothetical protein